MKTFKLFAVFCLLGSCYPSQGDLIIPAHPQQPDTGKFAEILEKVTTAVAGLGEKLHVLNVKFANIWGELRSSLVANLKYQGQIPREDGGAPQEPTPRPKQMGALDAVIQNPKAKLYTGYHLTGDVANYDYNNANGGGGCYDRFGDWKFVDPGHSCVRLFAACSCRGKSLAIYPGSKNNDIGAIFTRVCSVGPCFENEFTFATLSRTSAGIRVLKSADPNLRQVPDLVETSRTTIMILTGSSGSIREYNMESGRRIKCLLVRVDRGHLKSPFNGATISSAVSQHWNTLDKQEGDQMGLIVPTNFGGPLNATFNIFPQSPSNALEWKKVTDRALEIVHPLCGNNGAIFFVNFLYENSQGTRPYALTYNMNLCNNGVIENGFIPN